MATPTYTAAAAEAQVVSLLNRKSTLQQEHRPSSLEAAARVEPVHQQASKAQQVVVVPITV